MAPRKQARAVKPGGTSGHPSQDQEPPLIRPVAADDLKAVAEIDRLNTGVAKPDYWRDIFERYGQSPRPRFFLVAEGDDSILGFIIGEVRAWEFGSEPCGWVFAIGVRQDMRLHHIGTHLLDALDERLRQAGASKVRTMLRRDNHLLMSFFRSQGMMAGSFLQLEKDLEEPWPAAAEMPGRHEEP
jgi:ribosomal protein S18 acetylase RimI-like enzyme